MVYPLQPGQGDAIDSRRLEIQARIDELDEILREIRAKLATAVAGSAEQQRLAAESNAIAQEAGALFAELDYLDDPAEFEEDMEMDDDSDDADYDGK